MQSQVGLVILADDPEVQRRGRTETVEEQWFGENVTRRNLSPRIRREGNLAPTCRL